MSVRILQAPIPPKKAVAKKGKNGDAAAPIQVDEETASIGQVEALALNADGSLVSAVYLNKILALWKVSTGELIAQR